MTDPSAPSLASLRGSAADGAVVSTERLSSAFEALRAELEALQSANAMHEKRASELDQREASMQQHAAHLSEREHEVAQRHREMNEAQAQLVSAASEWRVRENELLQREAALSERETEQARQGDLSKERGRLELRRERLRRQRRLLQERTQQLLRAKEALVARAKQMEKLSQTQMHAQAQTHAQGSSQPPVGAAAARPAQDMHSARASTVDPSRAAPKQPAAAMFMLSTGAAALGVVAVAAAAWWAAAEIEPPTYLVGTKLAMEPGRDLELAPGWREHISEMVMDPQILERSAEKLGRRGYADLATPTDLRRRLDQDLAIDSPSPTELSITLRGQGEQRTQRILDTLSAEVVTRANDGRHRRRDGSMTLVAARVSADADPVSEGRLMTAGALGAGFLVIASAAGLAVTRLVNRPSAVRRVDEDDGLSQEEKDRWRVGP